MPPSAGVAGWDLGGAHLKLSLFDGDSRLQQLVQLAMPLWQGLGHLDEAIATTARQWPLAEFRHAVTMSGELVDLFDSRTQGVQRLADRVGALLGDVRLFAGPRGFVSVDHAQEFATAIASANWYATAACIAGCQSRGLLVDMGSTTTDIVALRDGRVDHRGYTDRERLASGELVYTGVVRTPVMATTQELPFDGEWLQPANEHFATMADVYRVLGWLPPGTDLHATADGRDKSATASARRLARMVGADLADAGRPAWREIAAYVADRQMDVLARACRRQCSRGLSIDAPLIGAGSGRFVVQRLAARLDRRYLDIDDCLPVPHQGGLSAGTCAPAVAVALLAQQEQRIPRGGDGRGHGVPASSRL